MSRTQIVILAAMAVGMLVIAMAMGNWAEQLNPEGIAAHPVADEKTLSSSEPQRDAFSFGVSMGLLGTGLLYSCIAFGLFIQARSKNRAASQFIFWVAGFALLGFALSYLIDDYFY